MPTPDETRNVVARSPPLESSSSRASFASCPPEEDRETHAPRETRADTPPILGESFQDIAHTSRQNSTSAPDTQAGALHIRREQHVEQEKAEHVEDASIARESPSPVGSPDVGSDSDVKLAQSMATAMLGSGEPAPRYIYFPPEYRNQVWNEALATFGDISDNQVAITIFHKLLSPTWKQIQRHAAIGSTSI